MSPPSAPLGPFGKKLEGILNGRVTGFGYAKVVPAITFTPSGDHHSNSPAPLTSWKVPGADSTGRPSGPSVDSTRPVTTPVIAPPVSGLAEVIVVYVTETALA